jgi:putative hemolysin
MCPDPRPYALRITRNGEDVEAIQRLRHEVFVAENLFCPGSSRDDGLDADEFDFVCSHLVVSETRTHTPVATYRAQSGREALRNLGYYSSREFDLSPMESLRPNILEVGRACIKRSHRSFAVLSLLWRGLATYARSLGCHFLLGCCTATAASTKAASKRFIDPDMISDTWWTKPIIAAPCEAASWLHSDWEMPKLLKAYLRLGAKICAPPALDTRLNTVDFLILLDLRHAKRYALRTERDLALDDPCLNSRRSRL